MCLEIFTATKVAIYIYQNETISNLWLIFINMYTLVQACRLFSSVEITFI